MRPFYLLGVGLLNTVAVILLLTMPESFLTFLVQIAGGVSVLMLIFTWAIRRPKHMSLDKAGLEGGDPKSSSGAGDPSSDPTLNRGKD